MACLTLLASLALRGALDELVSDHSRDQGVTLSFDYGASQGLVERIRNGDRADIALLTAGGIESLQREGILAAGSRVDLVRSDIGLAVKDGTPLPDIGSAEAFKQALLRARSLAYSDIGASGIYLKSLLQRLGIAEQVNAKAKILPPGLTGELVLHGEVELALQQVSELMQVAGLRIARLPAEIQQATVFSAAVFSASPSRQAAGELIRFLSSAPAATVMARHGFEPIDGSRQPSP